MPVLGCRQQHLAQCALVREQDIDHARTELLPGLGHLKREGWARRLFGRKFQQPARRSCRNAIVRIRKRRGIDPDLLRKLNRVKSDPPRHIEIAAHGHRSQHRFHQ